MKFFKGEIATDSVGSGCEFEFEVEDDATQEEIDAEARQAAFDLVSWSYTEIKGGE